MTKCTFHKFGPSGTVEKKDGLCVLPLNIINEKIYVFLWFWFMILTILTIFDVFHHFGLLWFTGAREMIFRRKLRTCPKHKVEGKVERGEIDVSLVSRSLSHGDWALCYHLIKNMDAVTYGEWLEAMTDLLRSANPPVLPQSLLNNF